ncbi:MAG: branched-chain amino acid ABC transporter substrate-binding protein, partial [Chloroflexus sp.]|nr:branched-chain amino acid ABC transporter substrate-binding protein [Chloroflexus sp.]
MHRRRRTFGWLIVMALFATLLAACGGGGTGGGAGGGASAEPIKVGAIFDLTGATADVGTPYARGQIA